MNFKVKKSFVQSYVSMNSVELHKHIASIKNCYALYCLGFWVYKKLLVKSEA